MNKRIFERYIRKTGTTKDLVKIVEWFSTKEDMTTEKMSYLCYFAYSWAMVILKRRIAPFAFERIDNNLYERHVLKAYGKNYKFIGYTLERPELNNDVEAVLKVTWNLYGSDSEEELLARIRMHEPFLLANPMLSDQKIYSFYSTVITNK